MGKAAFAAAVCAVCAFAQAARVDLHPHQFDPGGWKLDVQFMDEMGSPQLLAHGCGIPVPMASVEAEIPAAGAWRVWVRSRKWVDGAGAFRVKVDGTPLAKTFGVSQGEWAWEDGGTVELKKGVARIQLEDMDGFDGRCAGIVLVNDGSRPEGALKPGDVAETVDADFVVVGGGLPGCCAAVAAARRGLNVVLVNDRPVLGGNASSEIRVWCGGEARYPLVKELRGWFMNRDANLFISDDRRLRIIENEKTLSLRLCTRVFAAEKEGGRIKSALALDWKRGRTVRLRAPLFCDATGDGWLGAYAGADFRMGREAADEFNETRAPKKADGRVLGASLMWTSAVANTDIPFHAPWAEPHAQGVTAVNGEWNWEYGITRNMVAEAEAIRDRLFLAIYGAFSRAKRNPAHSRRVLNNVPFLLGKRESRRLMGDYVLSESDVKERREFEDGIASGSWAIDLHEDNCKKGVDFLTTCSGGTYGRYWIPYRTIYSRNVENLFMAGRCFSCTHVGLGSPRVMNTLAQLGCAAGEAAALCRERGLLPRGIVEKKLARTLQRRLGGDFPGNPDPAHAEWRYIDDMDERVKFGKGWKYRRFHNGDQFGHGAHTVQGSLSGAGDVVYPLPVGKAGRYALMGRVPYLYNNKSESETEMEISSGGEETRFTVNQIIGTGDWRKLGVFDLAPGATLRIRPSASSGTVIADGFAIAPETGSAACPHAAGK